MISRKEANYALIASALILITASIILYYAGGESIVLAILSTIFYSLSIDYSTIPLSKANNIFFVSAGIINTFTFAILTVLLASWFWYWISNIQIKEKIILNRIKKLRNHAIIVPFNQFAKEIIEELDKRKIETVVICNNRKQAHDLLEENIMAIYGDIKSEDSYRLANVSSAKYVFAVSESESENAIASVNVRSMNKKAKVFARCKFEDGAAHLTLVGAYKAIIPEEYAVKESFEYIFENIGKGDA
ncbi:MAG: NAD-binding protein [Candidatus Micrarchaeaceae archaeon]